MPATATETITEYYCTETADLDVDNVAATVYASSVAEAAKEFALRLDLDLARTPISVALVAVIEAADEADARTNDGLDEQDHEFRDYETFCDDFVTTLGGFVEGDRVMGGDIPDDFDVGPVVAIGPGGVTVAFEWSNETVEVPAEGLMPADQDVVDRIAARLKAEAAEEAYLAG